MRGALSRGSLGAVAAVAGCVAAAALTLLLPSSPSYDPWSWLVWGRELVGGDLRTEGGPSWKPLPVLFTAPFSLTGDAAPDLWLVTARAGAFGAVLAAGALGARLGGALAAVAAGGLLLLAPWLWGAVWTGNSEGLLVLCVLGAAERHLAGRHGQAFALGLAGGLLRPEAWAFVGLYGLWLVARDRHRLPWVLGGLALLPALWLLPELWGSGSLLRGAERAREPGFDSPALAARPALTVIDNAFTLVSVPVLLGLGAGVATAALHRGAWAARAPAVLLAVLALVWLAEVAAMAELGFAGIHRYLFVPVAIVHVLAGVGLGWALNAVLAAPWRRGGLRLGLAGGLTALAIAGTGRVLAFDVSPIADQLSHEAAVTADLDDAVAGAGGRRRVERCGPLYATFMVTPPVAWTLERHLEEVSPFARAPGTVLRARLLLSEPPDPLPDALSRAPDAKLLARTAHWTVEAACRARRRRERARAPDA